MFKVRLPLKRTKRESKFISNHEIVNKYTSAALINIYFRLIIFCLKHIIVQIRTYVSPTDPDVAISLNSKIKTYLFKTRQQLNAALVVKNVM
jgi:hypothetical protein